MPAAVRDKSVMCRIREITLFAVQAEAVRIGTNQIEVLSGAMAMFMSLHPQVRDGWVKRPRQLSGSKPVPPLGSSNYTPKQKQTGTGPTTIATDAMAP